MKQLLFIIITFMFVSNVYAQSPAEILGKGRVVSSQYKSIEFTGSIRYFHDIILVHENKVFSCSVDTFNNEVDCKQMNEK